MTRAKLNLSPAQLSMVEQTLANDEAASDAELEAYFIANGLTTAQATGVMTYRHAYLTNIYFDGDGPLHDA